MKINKRDVDARDKRGHDAGEVVRFHPERAVVVHEALIKSRRFLKLSRSDACCLDNRRPTRDLALNQRSKRLRAARYVIWNVAAEVEQALAHALVVECVVERVGELVED